MNKESDNKTKRIRHQQGKQKLAVPPSMSYTAVTTHPSMAEAFVKELLRWGAALVPDRALTIDDLILICQTAAGRAGDGAVVVEGRYLRDRISEQISRAERYTEVFSIIVLHAGASLSEDSYDSISDALAERMRNSDLLFFFKSRIVLLLPHTPKDSCDTLVKRIRVLLENTVDDSEHVAFASATYPGDTQNTAAALLDWVEDRLRT